MKEIVVVAYSEDWPIKYQQESHSIKNALQDNLLEIHHIGSTSIHGMSAKPIIDIIATVKDFSSAIPDLEAIGYESRGEMHLPFREYFRKGKEVNLHLYENETPEIALNLAFRNYLRNHSDEAQLYQELKAKLLSRKESYEKNNTNYTGYNLGKNEFIRKILKESGFDGIRLMYCNHYDEWENYHRIRKEQIFSRCDVVYDRNHTSITDKNNFHFVLYKGIDIVTVAQIEFLEEFTVLRSLATDYPHKNKGYGTEMMSILERLVRSKGKKEIKMHAELSAEKFYRKLGYKEVEFNDPSISKNIIDLGKKL